MKNVFRNLLHRKQNKRWIRSVEILVLVVIFIFGAFPVVSRWERAVPENPLKTMADAYSAFPVTAKAEVVPGKNPDSQKDGLQEDSSSEKKDQKGDIPEPGQEEAAGEDSGESPKPSGGPGGGGGDEDGPAGNARQEPQEEPKETPQPKNPWFSTDLHEAVPYTTEKIAFKIRHHNMEGVSVKEIRLTLDGTLFHSYAAVRKNFQIIMKEGVHQLQIQVTYVRADQSEYPVSQEYHLEVVKESIVIQSSLEKKDGTEVKKPELSFTAKALMGEKEVPVKVIHKNSGQLEIDEADGKYHASLTEGENEFVIQAEKDGKKAKKSYTVTYQPPEEEDNRELWLEPGIEAPLVVYSPELFFAPQGYYGEDPVPVRVVLGEQEYEADENGLFHLTLAEGDNQIYMEVSHGSEKKGDYYLVNYDASSEHHYEDDPNAPVIYLEGLDANVENVISNICTNISIHAVDCNGNLISASNGNGTITVTCSGEILPILYSDGRETSYLVNLQPMQAGDTVTVTVTDSEGRSTVANYRVVSTATGQETTVGTVTISIDAKVLGMDYLIPPVQMEIPLGARLSTMVEQLLADNGMISEYTGTPETNYYLKRILYQDGREFVVPDIPQDLYDRGRQIEGFVPDSYQKDSLGEFDFSTISGWMYCVDGHYPNIGFSDYIPHDGQEVRIRFTLWGGCDIGGGEAMGNKDSEESNANWDIQY